MITGAVRAAAIRGVGAGATDDTAGSGADGSEAGSGVVVVVELVVVDVVVSGTVVAGRVEAVVDVVEVVVDVVEGDVAAWGTVVVGRVEVEGAGPADPLSAGAVRAGCSATAGAAEQPAKISGPTSARPASDRRRKGAGLRADRP
jgi:hypothetical protein